MRNEKDPDAVSRRQVLSVIGTGVVATSAIGQVASATPEEARGIRNAQSVQQILSTVGYPEITTKRVNHI